MVDGISRNDAASLWGMTKKQVKKLDKLDGNKDGTISGDIFTQAQKYYQFLEQAGVKYGKKEAKIFLEFMESYDKNKKNLIKERFPGMEKAFNPDNIVLHPKNRNVAIVFNDSKDAFYVIERSNKNNKYQILFPAESSNEDLQLKDLVKGIKTGSIKGIIEFNGKKLSEINNPDDLPTFDDYIFPN